MGLVEFYKSPLVHKYISCSDCAVEHLSRLDKSVWLQRTRIKTVSEVQLTHRAVDTRDKNMKFNTAPSPLVQKSERWWHFSERRSVYCKVHIYNLYSLRRIHLDAAATVCFCFKPFTSVLARVQRLGPELSLKHNNSFYSIMFWFVWFDMCFFCCKDLRRYCKNYTLLQLI